MVANWLYYFLLLSRKMYNWRYPRSWISKLATSAKKKIKNVVGFLIEITKLAINNKLAEKR